jgi:deoxycytidylate deaminase
VFAVNHIIYADVEKKCVKTYHAEMNAIYRVPKSQVKNAVMYVWRVRPDGTLGLSKPCEKCQRLIRKRGIRNVFYSTEDQTFVRM